MKIIAHLDMDAFFAACEERANPQFAGWGIVVGADPKNGTGRGVVSTANYQARKYGIHSAMPISAAWRLSQKAQIRWEPKTVFLPVNMSFYQIVSEKIMNIIHQYVQVVEQTSIDEAYLDLSFCLSSSGDTNTSDRLHLYQKVFEKAETIVLNIKKEIKEKEQLTCSAGIGPNKLIAKIASVWSKPDGLTVIYPDEVEKFLDPLPIGDIPGIGPKSEEFFHKKKIYKISDLKKVSKEQLAGWMRKWGEDIYQKVRGIDDSPVTAVREIKSISEQETFDSDTLSAAVILDRLNELAARVLERMKYDKVNIFKTVTIVVRFSDFTTKNRSHTLKDYSDSLDVLKMESIKLILPFLDKRENPRLQKIRLIGVGIEHFKREENFGEDKKEKSFKKKQMIEQLTI